MKNGFRLAGIIAAYRTASHVSEIKTAAPATTLAGSDNANAVSPAT